MYKGWLIDALQDFVYPMHMQEFEQDLIFQQ